MQGSSVFNNRVSRIQVIVKKKAPHEARLRYIDIKLIRAITEPSQFRFGDSSVYSVFV